MRVSEIVVAALVSASLGNATGTYRFVPRIAASRNISFEAWDKAMEHANATGRATIQGPSLSKTDLSLIDGWNLSVTVMGNVHVPFFNDSVNEYVSGADLFFEPPPSISSKQPANLTTCLRVGVAKLEEKEKVDSSCRGFLSDECIAKLTEDGGACGFITPVDCRAKVTLVTRQFMGPGDGPAARIPLGETQSYSGDTRVYGEMVTGVFVSVIGSVVEDSKKSKFDDGLEGPSSLSCLKVTDTKPGSELPEEEEEDDEDEFGLDEEQIDDPAGNAPSDKDPEGGIASGLDHGLGWAMAVALAAVAAITV